MTIDERRASEDPTLRELQQLARDGQRLLEPLPRSTETRLWARISGELGLAATSAGSDDELAGRRNGAGRRSGAGSALLRWAPMAAAAAVAAIAGVGVGLGIQTDDAPVVPEPLATIELAALEDDVSATTATLLDDGTSRSIVVDLADLPPIDGFHEVWLLDADADSLVSLGPARPDGSYVVPDGVDLVDLSSLDVSAEPSDGDPTHSGQSLLRGDITWTS